jgi:membrane protein YqaA with SNARE-associated domain
MSTVVDGDNVRAGAQQPQGAGGRIVRLLAVFHRWAESGWAGSAVGAWAFLQGSVVPGPSDALLLPLGIADTRRVFHLALWATAGATLGGLIAYAIGALAFEEVGRPLLGLVGVSPRTLERSRALFERRGWMIVAASAISPLSTKVVCIAAGSFGVPPWHFAGGLLLGRAARFFGVATLVRFAGEWLRARLERRLGRPLNELR